MAPLKTSQLVFPAGGLYSSFSVVGTLVHIPISDSIYLVPAQNQGRFPFAQSIYVDAERKILFDAGIGPKLMGRFLDEHPVDIVIVSHTHPDHIAGCGLVSARSIPIFVPQEGEATFGSLDLLASRLAEGDEVIELWKRLVVQVMGFQEATATRTYNGRSAFDLGSVKLIAMHTPGHLDDHYCFLEEQSGVMLLFDMDLSQYGPWYGNRESDVNRYEASIRFVRSFDPQVVVSSHMGVLRQNAGAALDAFVARIPARDDQIASMLTEPRSVEELAAEFPFTPKFHPQLRPLFLYWEMQMVRKHLDRLVESGAVTPMDGRFVRK